MYILIFDKKKNTPIYNAEKLSKVKTRHKNCLILLCTPNENS